ncbi:MAG: hypothetical protein A2W26_13650 [Acidobacteria bacterium RBG_16_64_8]|nr:MAG: hypothetical protein A2W26_13650 [Acidobacteria bacterium RBG_16_64_8]
MSGTLVVHRRGWEATKADLASVPVPEPTESYHPVPYGRFVEEVELHVPRFGLKVQSEAFALAREGAQMFGVLTCTNGHGADDYALAIGLRSSYDRSLALSCCSGSRTFVCDNLAFSGEVTMSRKHTVHVFRDLPDLIYRMLSQVSSMRERIDGEIAAMKVCELPPAHAHHLMVEAIRANVLPASRLPKVLEAWEEPRHQEFAPRTAWSLFNAFTELQKGGSPRLQMEGSLRLTALFRRELQLA